MPFLSDLALKAVPYTAGEQPQDRAYIKLNTNENPYPPSPRVAEALREAASEQSEAFARLRLYPDPTCRALRETIAAQAMLTPDHVFVGNGSDEVLALAFAALFAGKRVAAPDITYSFFPVYAQLFQSAYVPVPVDDGLRVDVEGLLQADANVVLANPNAPTSLALPPKALSHFAQVLAARGHVLLVDEAYSAFDEQSTDDYVRAHDNLLVVHTLSKSHGLAGLRVGYALGHPALIEGLERIKNCFNSYTLDMLAQRAAQAALLDTEYTRTRTREVIRTRARAEDALRALGMAVLPSRTNFLFARAPFMAGKALYEALRLRGILVRHFDAPRTRDYVRITVGTDAQMDMLVAAICALSHGEGHP